MLMLHPEWEEWRLKYTRHDRGDRVLRKTLFPMEARGDTEGAEVGRTCR